MIGNVGTLCPPNGPCLVPVAPGLMAPSGVVMVGLTLVLRDLVQRRLGPGASLARHRGRSRDLGRARAARHRHRLGRGLPDLGAGRFRRLHAAAAPPLRDSRSCCRALAGLVVNSVVFLWLAFGILDFLLGQIIGKAWMVLLAMPSCAGSAAATRGSGWRRPEPRCAARRLRAISRPRPLDTLGGRARTRRPPAGRPSVFPRRPIKGPRP